MKKTLKKVSVLLCIWGGLTFNISLVPGSWQVSSIEQSASTQQTAVELFQGAFADDESSCSSDADCGGYDCHDGECRTSCTHDGEDDNDRCSSGYECSSGACVSSDDESSCSSDADCGGYDCHDGECRTSCTHDGEDDNGRCASGYECSSGECVSSAGGGGGAKKIMRMKQY